MSEQPRYKHDCDQCTFLGQLNDNDVDYDLYHCVQGGPLDGIPTVLARYGDDGPEYLSGLGFTISPLAEAERRAKEKNLPTTYANTRSKENMNNPNPAQFSLEVYGVNFTINNQVPYFIQSTLRDGENQNPETTSDLEDNAPFEGACDAIESLILAHARAGVDVRSKAYKEGLETTLEAIMNNLL